MAVQGWLLAAALAGVRPASAAGLLLPVSTAPFVSPSTAPYAAVHGTIGEIRIDRRNVFDPRVPGEDWWLFRFANAIHVTSREHVVRRELLLRTGEPWRPIEVLESERNLRASGFIRAAEIRASTAPSGALGLDVHTQDSWTTAPQVGVGTEGGDRYLIYGIEESNLLGYGKAVSLFHARVGSRSRDELRYQDPRLWGSRLQLTSLYATTHRGDEILAGVERPFFSLETDYAVHAQWARIIEEESMFQDALEATKFLHNFRAVSAGVGSRAGEGRDPVRRVSVGTHYERNLFVPTAETVPGTLPEGRELSGPVLGFGLIQPRFVKETYIDRMERVEDYNLGNELSLSAGAMMTAFGSDADRWTFHALDQQGLRFADGRFLLGQAGAFGRLRAGRPENVAYFANLNLFWKSWRWFPQTWVAHLEANTTRNLDGDKQLVLGGHTGLRGYKNNSFTGAHSVLLNLEDRVFGTREIWHLFVLGGAAFFETGAVAPRGRAIAWRDFKSDVGFGLRISPTRSTTGRVIRADLAYALNGGPGPDRWVVSIRGGQAFQIFNSTNRNVLSSPVSAAGEESSGERLRRR